MYEGVCWPYVRISTAIAFVAMTGGKVFAWGSGMVGMSWPGRIDVSISAMVSIGAMACCEVPARMP